MINRKSCFQTFAGHLTIGFFVALMSSCILLSGCNEQKISNIPTSKTVPTPGKSDSNPVASSTPLSQDAATDELRTIGKKIAAAILAKDADALMVYDRDDMRLADQASLKNKNSDLYCYLFGSNCTPGPNAPTIYEKLSTAQQPEINVSVRKSPDGRLYGLLIFYDKSQIS